MTGCFHSIKENRWVSYNQSEEEQVKEIKQWKHRRQIWLIVLTSGEIHIKQNDLRTHSITLGVEIVLHNLTRKDMRYERWTRYWWLVQNNTLTILVQRSKVTRILKSNEQKPLQNALILKVFYFIKKLAACTRTIFSEIFRWLPII